MKLKIYQLEAIEELLEKSIKSLAINREMDPRVGGRKIVFKAPTGSGKTIMMAEFLRQLTATETMRDKLSFIWVAPRKLHAQSKNKLEKYYESNRAVECLEHGGLNDRQIGPEEILFLNWESINKKGKNILIRENEQQTNLGKIIENTYNAGRFIVLIIDESHHHAKTENSQNLIRDFKPKLTVDVSATPSLDKPDEMVSVDIFDVKNEGMIKKSVVLNEGFKNILRGERVETELSQNLNDAILEIALAKRKKLSVAFKKEGASVNPLLLIQLPDKKRKEEEQVKADAIALLKNHDITVANGKLAIYLSEDKENLANIARNDNAAEVMLFKQAIALGWDCPRAQILVLFREWRSQVFSVQTLGRIMRMPQPENAHYKNDSLNNGYVFTNLGNIEIKEDLAGGYLTIYTSHRDESYRDIKLPSVYKKRQREKTRLSPRYSELFLLEAKEYNLARKINIDDQQVSHRLITDVKGYDVDALANTEISGDFAVREHSKDDLQTYFNGFVQLNIRPMHPESRSVARVRKSIYAFFEKYFQVYYENDGGFIRIIKSVLSEDNKNHFVYVIKICVEKYLAEMEQQESEVTQIKDWQVPENINYGENYRQMDVKKSLMKPFYGQYNLWKSEKTFIAYLEGGRKVKWWFKNGDQGAGYFAVPYSKNDEIHLFYVDFIVQLANGKIGLYDTKSGRTIDDSNEKRNGLRKYLAGHKNILGGIVANLDQSNYQSAWITPPDNLVTIGRNNLSEWNLLDLS